MTLRTVLLSLQALLAAAEPDDPQDAVVAKQFKENQDMFRQTARHWTFIYAGGTRSCSPESLAIYNGAFFLLFPKFH
jgi:ubiquitin-conjugating enzyme (huntingtin interacting protein 2)